MLRPRIIPCLLIHKGGLVKTVKFADPKYIGDPLNTVRIFNEKEVDELLVVDIDATTKNREPNYELIKSLASECRMPLCYGGGVKTVEQFEKIISLGVEKISISSAAVSTPELVVEAARRVGRQSVVVVMDVKRSKFTGSLELYTHNGSKKTGFRPAKFAQQMEMLGAGEIVVNAIDRDGVMSGYDTKLIREVSDMISLPITALGGAGSFNDIEKLMDSFGIIGAAAGSMFVFKGKYRAVLISYLSGDELDKATIRSQSAGQ